MSTKSKGTTLHGVDLLAAERFNLRSTDEPDNSDDNPSIELTDEVQEDDLGVDSKEAESFLFLAENFGGVLELKTE